MKRRGFLGALLAAPLALVGLPRVRRWTFPAMPHSAPLVTPEWLTRETAMAFERDLKFASSVNRTYYDAWANDAVPGLKRGDTITLKGVWS